MREIRPHQLSPALAPVIGLFLALTLSAQESPPPLNQKISAPGRYQGYSAPLYKEWVRSSQYVPVRDGTRLAVDIIRPSRDGQPVAEPLPVIWTFTPYGRAARLPDGRLMSQMEQLPWLPEVSRHGYVVAAADIRGTGASFGHIEGNFIPQEAADAFDITEWLAAQPWSTGKIGMFGISYLGITQYMAASVAPPHLVAIMPDMAMFDLYSFTYPGGVYQDNFLADWSGLVKMLSTVQPAAPVDEDKDGGLLKAALAEHQANRYPVDYAVPSPFRDSPLGGTTPIRPFIDWSPHAFLKGLQGAGSRVAVYHVAGWFDMWSRDAVTWFNNFRNPQKLIIAPWSHSHDFAKGWKATVEPLTGFVPKFDYAAEQLRWFDYWLKGINNGVMNEDAVHYFTMGAAEGKAWKSARQWPLPEVRSEAYYFQAGPSGSVRSGNDGFLSRKQPSGYSGMDDCVIDYTTSSGPSTRWHNGRGGDFGYSDMAGNDAKGLTYTTAPLEAAVEVTGHPVVHLWVTSTADDGDFFAYLEEVDETGFSHYISEGVLRASHRRLAAAPYSYMNLPYHRSFKEDIGPLPKGQAVELVFDLLPTSNIFDPGHRIRLTITGSDQTSFLTPELSPPPRVSVFRNRKMASFVELPVVPDKDREKFAGGLVLSTTLLVLAFLIVVIVLVIYLRSRLKK
ncbi:MAG: hypothetical protein A2W03_07940 [Candidatus Aminicenantes bacterium RBG_16_63_16]|nr:MAG: hypothetical protein A2W03_07940 [Candidatus Aminicenantes bacterium RBG_16_63_16]